MTATALGEIILLGVLVMASAFFSSSEAALFSLGLYRVRRLKGMAGNLTYRTASALLKEPTKLISTILAGNETVNTAIGVVGTALVYDLFHGRVPADYLTVLSVALVTPFVLVFGEMIPKTLGVKHPEIITRLTSVPLALFSATVAPVRDALSWVSGKLIGMTGGERRSSTRVTEEVFRSIVDAGHEEGVLDTQEQTLIHNVFQLDDLRVAQIMTPVQKVSSLRSNQSVGEVLAVLEKDRYSRFPVRDAAGKEVEGVLYAKDLLGSDGLNPASSIVPFLRTPLLVVPETNALDLFAQFKARHMHFAVVVPPTSREMLGVVTLDDVLQRIFGEIRDERDVEEGAPSKR